MKTAINLIEVSNKIESVLAILSFYITTTFLNEKYKSSNDNKAINEN